MRIFFLLIFFTQLSVYSQNPTIESFTKGFQKKNGFQLWNKTLPLFQTVHFLKLDNNWIYVQIKWNFKKTCGILHKVTALEL